MTIQQLVLLALQASILLMVFGFGLRATVADALYVVRRPSLLARSLVAMFVVMPVVAVTLAVGFALRPPVEIALIALAISPVPPLLPMKTGGRQSYAIGLMAVASVLALVAVPPATGIIGVYFGRPFAMAPDAIVRIVFPMIFAPLVAGMVVRSMAPAFAGRIARPVARVATVLLAGGVLAVLVAAAPAFLSLIGNGTIVAMTAFVTIGLAVGHWMGGTHGDERTVLAFSTAGRHPAIALAIGRTNFPDEPLLGASILLYLLVGVIVGLLYGTLLRRAQARPSPA